MIRTRKEDELIRMWAEHIGKFPKFNPYWPAEIQEAWYSVYHRIVGQLAGYL